MLICVHCTDNLVHEAQTSALHNENTSDAKAEVGAEDAAYAITASTVQTKMVRALFSSLSIGMTRLTVSRSLYQNGKNCRGYVTCVRCFTRKQLRCIIVMQTCYYHKPSIPARSPILATCVYARRSGVQYGPWAISIAGEVKQQADSNSAKLKSIYFKGRP